MKLTMTLLICLFVSVTLFTSCEKDEDPYVSNNEEPALQAKKKRRSGSTTTPPADPYVVTYQLEQVVDYDPLFRFSITQSGQKILLETDPSVTSWGTNYWGYWSNPYTLNGNVVNITIGLGSTTYELTPLPNNKIEVTKTLVVQPYLGGSPTTTVTNPGIYSVVN